LTIKVIKIQVNIIYKNLSDFNMNIRALMNKQKLRVDNIVCVAIVIVIFTLLMFFRLIAIMSIVVYPMTVLIPYGIYKSYKIIFNRELKISGKVIIFIFQVSYAIFSLLFLNMLFSYPHITLSYIIYFLSIPTLLIGFAGFLKGLIIEVYSPSLRILNMIIGIITVIETIIAIIFADVNFLFHFITLLAVLSLNGILRAALYLSEYGLSLKKMRNFKIVFIIMDNLVIQTPEIEETTEKEFFFME